jgi:hypothetical protein
MRVLVACERTGIIRDAFAKRGHDAISCDLQPSLSPGKHYQGNVFDIIDQDFDLMIAHPPCTYISWAGKAYWNRSGRVFERLKALEFFARLLEYENIGKRCIENPLGCADAVLRPHDRFRESLTLWRYNGAKLFFMLHNTCRYMVVFACWNVHVKCKIAQKFFSGLLAINYITLSSLSSSRSVL